MDNITTIAEMLSKEIQQELATEYTLSDIEKTTRRLVQEIGRRAIAVVVNSEEQPRPALEISCPSCGQAIPYVRRRPAHLRTLFGRMEVKRAYYLCAVCQRGYCPLRRATGTKAQRHQCGTGTTGRDDWRAVALWERPRPLRGLDPGFIKNLSVNC